MMFAVFPITVQAQLTNKTSPIANIDVSVDEMSYNEAVQYFTGRATRWPDGTIIILIVLPQDASTTKTFVFEHLGMTSSQLYESLKINSTIRKHNTVSFVENEREMLKKISQTQGALGYVNNMFIILNNNEFKIIRIR